MGLLNARQKTSFESACFVGDITFFTFLRRQLYGSIPRDNYDFVALSHTLASLAIRR